MKRRWEKGKKKMFNLGGNPKFGQIKGINYNLKQTAL